MFVDVAQLAGDVRLAILVALNAQAVAVRKRLDIQACSSYAVGFPCAKFAQM